MSGTDWYDVEPPEIGVWWWAVEHLGHPAFYLRALMPGDFAPGRAPLERHALSLSGEQRGGPVRCGTCGGIPEPADLDAVERRTGVRDFLEVFRAPGHGRIPWPKPTDPASCWECSGPSATLDREVAGRGQIRICGRCAAHADRGGK